jgi:hypothetical protein
MMTGVFRMLAFLLGLVVLQPQAGFVGLVVGVLLIAAGGRYAISVKRKVV